MELGNVQGNQHYRLLPDLVPGASAAPRVLLHSEYVPVVIIPADVIKHLGVTGVLPAESAGYT